MLPVSTLLPLLFNTVVARLNGPRNDSFLSEESSARNDSFLSNESSVLSSSARRLDILWTCEVIQMGEIRHGDNLQLKQNGDSSTSQRRPARCLDVKYELPHPWVLVEDYMGKGKVQTADCDGDDDQLWALCRDGTIRNLHSRWCLTRSDTLEGKGNVFTSGCTIPAPTASQVWLQSHKNVLVDYLSGLEQTRFRLSDVSSSSQRCMAMPGGSSSLPDNYGGGIGFVETWSNSLCTWSSQHSHASTFWYFNNRGGVIETGRLVNQDSNKCLTQQGRRRYNIVTKDCKDDQTQLWTLYESGELINAKDHRCLEAETNAGTGNIRTVSGCRSYSDLRWKRAGLALGSFLIQNDQSQKCLGISRRRRRAGNAQTYDCIDTPDLRFRWQAAGWATPVGFWNQVACSYSGPITRDIIRTITSSKTITETTTVTVGAEIDKGVIFAGAKVSVSVSQSLAYSWMTSTTDTTWTSFTCENFDDGTPVGGSDFVCMYQWEQTIASQEDTIRWKPLIIKCTSGNSPPQCPAFERCAGDDCSSCESV